MRLVFVNRFFFPDHSATSQMLTDLCFALTARGHEVHVVTSRLRYDDPGARLDPEETVEGVRVHRVWTSRFGRASIPGRAMDYLTFYLSTLFKLLALADARTTIVAKTDPPVISVLAAIAAKIKGARLVNWTQDLFPEVAQAAGMRIMRPAVAAPLAAMRDWSLRRAACTVTIGERMRDRLSARGIPGERLAVIHNWADGEAIAPLAHQANPLRAQWQLEDKLVVGYSGNLGRVHEFDTVLSAAEILRDDPRILFLFIGGGHKLRLVQEQVAALNMKNVRFRPYQPREHLARSLGACDAHLVTLRPELEGLVLPSKLYGILAAGRPVLFVGAPEGDVQSLVREGECGAAFETRDSKGLADCVLRLAGESSPAARWGENARQLFDRRFAKALAIGQWERELQAVEGAGRAHGERYNKP